MVCHTIPMKDTMSSCQFHKNHGVNVRLQSNRQVARRFNSFANAITFSESVIRPGEIFMVEVEEHEPGWSGHLRCGLTQHSPASMLPMRPGAGTNPTYDGVPQYIEFPVDGGSSTVKMPDPPKYLPIPQYSMPDLTNLGKAWIHAITKYHNKQPSSSESAPESDAINTFVENCGDAFRVGRTILPRETLVRTDFLSKALCDKTSEQNGSRRSNHEQMVFATSVGSRVAVTYDIRTNEETKLPEYFMHLIINGEDQGPIIMEGVDPEKPFFAIVDVYGTTKQVRIIQVNIQMPSLQELCRFAIRKITTDRQVTILPIPARLKDYLRFHELRWGL